MLKPLTITLEDVAREQPCLSIWRRATAAYKRYCRAKGIAYSKTRPIRLSLVLRRHGVYETWWCLHYLHTDGGRRITRAIEALANIPWREPLWYVEQDYGTELREICRLLDGKPKRAAKKPKAKR